MLILLILFFIAAPAHGFDLSYDHPFYLPVAGQLLGEIGENIGHREIEYDTNDIIIDEQHYKFNTFNLKFLYSPIERFAIGIGGSYDADREYELRFGPESSRFGEQAYRSSARGFMDPDLIFIYEFYAGKDSWNQQVFVKFNPFDIEAKPRAIYRGGHDVFVQYRYSHKYESGALYGSLFSHYFGKKEFYLPGDSRLSVSEPYTEVGCRVGYLFKVLDRWSFLGESTFGLSSDYIVRTPDVNREADKGYQLFGGLGVQYLWSDQIYAKAFYTFGKRVYNATKESLERNIDYEIEDNFLTLSFTFLLGGEK